MLLTSGTKTVLSCHARSKSGPGSRPRRDSIPALLRTLASSFWCRCALQPSFGKLRIDAERISAAGQAGYRYLAVRRAEARACGPLADEFTQRRLIRNIEYGIEIAADRLSERGARLGHFGGTPDPAEPKAWANLRGQTELVLEIACEHGVVAVVSEFPLLQLWPQLMLDVLPGVVAADPTEPVLILPACCIVKRSDRRTHVQPCGRRR